MAGVARPDDGPGTGTGGVNTGPVNPGWAQRPDLGSGGAQQTTGSQQQQADQNDGGGTGHGDGTLGGGGGGGVAGDPEQASTSGSSDPDTSKDPSEATSDAHTPSPKTDEPTLGDTPDAPDPEGEEAQGDTEPQERGPFEGLDFADAPKVDSERDEPRRRPVELDAPGPNPQADEPVDPDVERLRGTWRQVGLDPGATADFAPAGSSSRFLGIDPQRRRMLSVSGWGDPVGLVLAGEVEAGFRSSGRVSIRVREDLEGGKYPDLPATLPADWGTYERPTEEALELKWSLDNGVLRIGMRTYEPCEPSELDGLLQDSGAEAGATSTHAPVVSAVETAGAGSVDFFGLKATGRWFCYIVDVSGSMGRNGKLDRLKEELVRSLQALPSDARFYVLFFSGSTNTLQKNWLKASGSSGFIQQLGRVGSSGGTDPREAIRIALAQLDPKPDAIFFMTDGQIPGDCSGLVNQLNGASPKVRIHTVAFGADAKGASLSQIAADNGGQYRKVP